MTTSLQYRRLAGGVTAAGRRLVGHAAVFGSATRIDDLTETIAPGAFAATLRSGSDVLALVDHDASRLLARTASSSLVLREDDHGLAFEIHLPETQLARDVLALAERGDLGGMSFGFRVPNGGERFENGVRVLTQIDLVEISVVHAFPAYPDTTVEPRTSQDRTTINRWKRWLDNEEIFAW